MANPAWESVHAEETEASPDFAWRYWTNVANWDDPPAQFELDGPFVVGARGLTRIPGQEPIHWIIREVTPGKAAIIEILLDGAALAIEWKFAKLAEGRTRLTQRVVLRGEKADAYLEHARMFAANMPNGIRKWHRPWRVLPRGGPAERRRDDLFSVGQVVDLGFQGLIVLALEL